VAEEYFRPEAAKAATVHAAAELLKTMEKPKP
jgi:hypothetical protein